MQSGAKRKRSVLADIPMDGKLALPLLLLGRVEKQGAKPTVPKNLNRLGSAGTVVTQSAPRSAR